jgi:transposase
MHRRRVAPYSGGHEPFAGFRPPAALFFYSPDRKGEHPRAHLKDFRGVIHADGYAGFNELFAGGQIAEAACWVSNGTQSGPRIGMQKGPLTGLGTGLSR